MAFEGYRNLELLAHNESRNYPLIPSAIGTSEDSLFTLPTSTLVELVVDLPWDRDVDPGSLFVQKVQNLPEYLAITIAYASSDNIIGTFRVSRDGYQKYETVRLATEPDWADAAGMATFGELPLNANTPIGTFTFTPAATRLEVQCVRPSANSGLAGIQVESEGITSLVAHGIVKLRTVNNMKARVEQTGEGVFDIWLDAISGAGIDPECDCEGSVGNPIRTIQQISPDASGNFDIVGTKCLEVSGRTNGLQVTNPCSDPCCGCEEAETLTQLLTPLGQQINDLAGQMQRLQLAIRQLEFVVDVSDVPGSCDTTSTTT